MSKKVDGKDFLIGAVVGGVLGAMAALLLAPKSGRELRGDISEQYNNISEKTQKIASNVSEKTVNIAKTASSQTAEWVDKAKVAATTVVGEVKNWREGRKQATGTHENVEESVEHEDDAKNE
ncbi:MAG: YtxH-like protein [Bacilli bacterium]|nr:YtxH-like protein [Bacilli bacterium]